MNDLDRVIIGICIGTISFAGSIFVNYVRQKLDDLYDKINNSIIVNYITQNDELIPTYATAGSSGMDLKADIASTIVLDAFDKITVPTGIKIEMPPGVEAQIRPRSGLASKYGITVLNAPGTVDFDYSGEIKIILFNSNRESYVIYPGDKIAQMVFSRVLNAELNRVDVIGESERGENGFGSTGR